MVPRYCLVMLAMLLLPVAGHATTVEMKVNGLVCSFCAQGIEKRLRQFPATAEVLVSLQERLVAVSLHDGGDIDDQQLRKALEEAGYAVKEIRRTETPIAEIRKRLKQDR